MPDLFQSLQGRDMGHLKILAQHWGVLDAWSAPDFKVGVQRLAPLLLDRARVEAVVFGLPLDARQALNDLLQNEGRLPWALFTKRYGELREMGPGRRDRERPDLSPVSAAEALWYRGLAARSFLAVDEEYAYIPDDLAALMPATPEGGERPLGRPATPLERAFLIPANDSLLDHACTLLAGLRLGLGPEELGPALPAGGPEAGPYPLGPEPLRRLVEIAGLLDPAGLPLPEPARQFLEKRRGEALAQLVQAWLASADFNELRLLPGLSCEGEWRNDPRPARQSILDFLARLPGWPSPNEPANVSGAASQIFWSLPAFVAGVRQVSPDFQRPAGDYDSWYIRDLSTGEYLRGFEQWEAVDGALVRYLLAGPMHWLGLIDLAASAPGQPPTAFRLSYMAAALLRGEAPSRMAAEEAGLVVRSDGRIQAPRLAPRSLRYQVARFSAWDGRQEENYLYHLTPASLDRARQQGLRVSHLLALLRRHAGSVPPALARALDRWEERGVEARLESVVILRVSSPEILQALRSSRAARFLGDPLGPAAVLIRAGALEKVQAALLELGILGEIRAEPPG